MFCVPGQQFTLLLREEDVPGQFKDEVEVLKNQLAAVATEQTNTKNKLVSVKKSLEERKVRYAAMHRQFINTQKRLTEESQKTRDKDESAQEAEKFHGEMLQQFVTCLNGPRCG